jgi:hypothetical protein
MCFFVSIVLQNNVKFVYVFPKTNVVLCQLSSFQYFLPNLMNPRPLNDEVILKEKNKKYILNNV